MWDLRSVLIARDWWFREKLLANGRHTRDPKFVALMCMSFTSKGTSEVLVAGHQENMFVVDLNKHEVTKTVGSGSMVVAGKDCFRETRLAH